MMNEKEMNQIEEEVVLDEKKPVHMKLDARSLRREFKSWFFKQHTKTLTKAIQETDTVENNGYVFTIATKGKTARKIARRQIRNRLWNHHRGSKPGNQ